MEDGFEKEKKSIEADAKSKIEQLKQDGAKRGDVLEKQKELEQAITDAANAKITAPCNHSPPSMVTTSPLMYAE